MEIEYSIGLLPMDYFSFSESLIESDTFENFVRNISVQCNNGKAFASLLIGNIEASNDFFGEERIYGLFMETSLVSEKELHIALEIFRTVKPSYEENPASKTRASLGICNDPVVSARVSLAG